MTINQLFKKKPSQVIIVDFLNLLNILSFDDARYFSKKDIENSMIISELQKKSKMFEEFYLPCKFKIYFTDIDVSKVITILRQCLKVYNYTIKSTEKMVKNSKVVIYNIEEIIKTKNIDPKSNKGTIVFD
jgi:hypothetical protein